MASRRLTIPRDPSELSRKGISINCPVPFFKFQTVKEVRREPPTVISEQEYQKGLNQGTECSRTHNVCLECLGKIDPATCRSVNDGWGIGWHCEECGYFKKSHEMVMFFLRGAHVNFLEPQEVDKYKVRSFPWCEQPQDESNISIHPIYMQASCLAQQGGITVREAIGDAHFLAYPGIYDILARGWWGHSHDWTFIAVRLQGSIWITHERARKHYKGRSSNGDKERKRTELPSTTDQKPRKVHHFELVRSELRSPSRKPITLAVLNEFQLTNNGGKIRQTESGTDNSNIPRQQIELGHLIKMKVGGIHRFKQTYRDQVIEDFVLGEIIDRLEPELEQISWDFLYETLSLIQECLPIDGEYATVSLIFDHATQSRGQFTVENRGLLDSKYLREDFRETFHI